VNWFLRLFRRHGARGLILALGLHAGGALAAGETRPNLLLIVADDLGYGDLGCYGATRIKTPQLDRLAAQGVRLTDAHSTAAVCQPTRYAILSGTYFLRARRQGQQTLYFHEGQATLPGVLQAAGYRTAALGKWHLGFGRGAEPDYNAELKPGPLEIGFDSFFGCPRTHNEPPFVFVENHRVVGHDSADPLRMIAAKDTKQGWGHGISLGGVKAHSARPVDRIDLILAEKAAQFLGQAHGAPFFLYLAFLAPHVPIAPAPEFQGKSDAGRYGDFVQQLDACVGRVLDALQASGAAENTLVIFTSDNGGLYHRDALEAGHRPNGRLLGQKTDAWEGGHRVPFLARWPGRIPAGTQSSRLLGLTDLMATLAAAARVPLPAGAAPDSLNQLPVLLAPAAATTVRRELLAQGTHGYALRQDEWLFLPKPGSGGFTVQVPAGNPWGQPYAKMGVATSDIDARGALKPEAASEQLFNLSADPSQARNVARENTEVTAQLRRRLAELLPPPRPTKKANPSKQ
jgi:arylsulfatase A-like enzyme